MTRKEITQLALEKSKELGTFWSLEKGLLNWWSGSDGTNSLQLTHAGHEILKNIFEHYPINFSGVTISPRVILQLTKLDCPWYLFRQKNSTFIQTLHLFSQRQTINARLFIGSNQKNNESGVDRWLHSL